MAKCLLFLFAILWSTHTLNFTYVNSYQDTIARVREFPNHLSSLFITTTATECEKCQEAIKVYEEFMYEVDAVVKAYVLDCKYMPETELENIPACHVGNADQLPGLMFLSPPEPDQPQIPVEKQFTGPLSLQGILEYAYKNAPNFSVELEDEDQFNSIFLKNTAIPNKVLLLKADDFTPFWFKGLTSAFRGRLDFAEIDVDVLKRKYQLSGKTSELMIFKYDPQKKTYEHIVYDQGKRYSNLKKFLKPFALKQQQKKTGSIYDEDPKRWGRVDQIILEQFNDIFNLNEQWVLVHFIDNDKQVQHPQFQQFKKSLKGLAHMFQINCSSQCQSNKWIKKNVRQYPDLVVLPFVNKKVTKPIHIHNKG